MPLRVSATQLEALIRKRVNAELKKRKQDIVEAKKQGVQKTREVEEEMVDDVVNALEMAVWPQRVYSEPRKKPRSQEVRKMEIQAEKTEAEEEEEDNEKYEEPSTEELEKYKIPPHISLKLKVKLIEMYKSVTLHDFVFPAKPKKGVVQIPRGGLIKCQCSPECLVDLPEPEYHQNNQELIERFNGPLKKATRSSRKIRK
uniref:Uncharacterized protein n=1 Tax=Caenorhabditis japonica TaxID=281687 RepID=A0A8R1DRI5_CAEJA